MCNSQSQLKFSVSKFEFSILIFAETVSESAKKQLFFCTSNTSKTFFLGPTKTWSQLLCFRYIHCCNRVFVYSCFQTWECEVGPSDFALNYIFKLIRGCLLFLDFQILIQQAKTQSLYPISFASLRWIWGLVALFLLRSKLNHPPWERWSVRGRNRTTPETNVYFDVAKRVKYNFGHFLLVKSHYLL